MNIFSTGANKLFLFPERVAAWRSGKMTSPICLEIQPTEVCNQRCPQCQGEMGRFSRNHNSAERVLKCELDLDLLKSVWDNPPLGVVISGDTGDPLLYSKLAELLHRLEILSIPTVLISNGEALTQDIAYRIVTACRGVRISLDAFDSKSYYNTHGVSAESWNRVLDNIKLLIETRTSANIKPKHCLIGVGYLTDMKTRKGIVKATKLARELGVDYIHFRPYHYRICSIDDELNDCKSFEVDPEFRILASYQKYNLIHSFNRGYTLCHGSNFFTVIDARADLYICCHHIGDRTARIGSLDKMTFQEILVSEERSKTQNLFPGKNCIPFCRLHTQNVILERIKSSLEPISETWLPHHIKQHAVFL